MKEKLAEPNMPGWWWCNLLPPGRTEDKIVCVKVEYFTERTFGRESKSGLYFMEDALLKTWKPLAHLKSKRAVKASVPLLELVTV